MVESFDFLFKGNTYIHVHHKEEQVQLNIQTGGEQVQLNTQTGGQNNSYL